MANRDKYGALVERVARALVREDLISAISAGNEETRGKSAIEVAIAGMKAEDGLWPEYVNMANAAIAAITEKATDE